MEDGNQSMEEQNDHYEDAEIELHHTNEISKGLPDFDMIESMEDVKNREEDKQEEEEVIVETEVETTTEVVASTEADTIVENEIETETEVEAEAESKSKSNKTEEMEVDEKEAIKDEENVTSESEDTVEYEEIENPELNELMELMDQIENYMPTVPDALSARYLEEAGISSVDPRIARFMSIAAQKFISEIANDALQHCKTRTINSQHSSGHNSNKQDKKPNKDRKYTLAVEDLQPALAENGITVRKPQYFV